MCSLNDDDDGTEFLRKEENDVDVLDEAICQKCNTEKAEVELRRKDVYCNGCFLVNTTHKFRATLGKSKIVRPNDTILVAYNGKAASAVLLNLIQAGMHESVHKRLLFKVKILYIDDGIITGLNFEERRKKKERIYEKIKSLRFESFGVCLSEIMNFNESSITSLEDFTCINHGNDKHLLDTWNSLIDETSREDYRKKLRYKLIIAVAKNLKCQKVFLADTSMSLAIAVLSNVSLGRGSQLSSNCAFMNNQDKDLMILRPIRDFSHKEIYYYLVIHNYEYLASEEKLTETCNAYSSIQRITEKFVINLEGQFNGTVSTIYRTGEKISASSNSDKIKNCEETCLLCNEYLDTFPLENCTSAVDATKFSKVISSTYSNSELDLNKITENASKSGKIKNSKCQNCTCQQRENGVRIENLTYDDVEQFFCYGCRRIFHGNFDFNTLPSCVMSSLKAKLRLSEIATEIQDFLL